MATFDQRGQHVNQQYIAARDMYVGVGPPQEADAARGAAGPPPIDVVIITPLEEERDAVLAKLDGHRQLPPTQDDIRVYFTAELPVTFPDGATATYRVVVMPLLNMGWVEAANATGDAIRRWRPRCVWLVGIAGGLSKAGVALGDMLIADQIADYELQKLAPEATSIRWQVHRVDQRLLGAARNLRGNGWFKLITCTCPDTRPPRRHSGAICTGDKVIANGLLDDYQEVWAKLVGVEEALLAQWRPPHRGCQVLVTSRRPRWETSLGVQLVPLGILRRDESLALLRHHRPDLSADNADLDAIAAELGDLPLALHLSGSFLARYRHAVTPAAYLAQLQQPNRLAHQSLQGWQLSQELSPTRHEQHVARTFALSYDRLHPADPHGCPRLGPARPRRALCPRPADPS